MTTMVPNKRNPNVAVSSLMVPELNGVGFLAPRNAANASRAALMRAGRVADRKSTGVFRRSRGITPNPWMASKKPTVVG